MIAILFFMYKTVLDILFLQRSYMKRNESCLKKCHGNYHNTKKVELFHFQKGRPVRKFRKKNMLKDLHHILPGSFSNIIHVLQSFTLSTLLLFLTFFLQCGLSSHSRLGYQTVSYQPLGRFGVSFSPSCSKLN